MTSERNHVIVEDGTCSRCYVHTKSLHHRDYPEVRAECGSIAEGAAHLAELLRRYREGAQSLWHRESIDLAIADVAEFLDSLAVAATVGKPSCACGARLSSPSGSPCASPLAGGEPRDTAKAQ